jgi:neurotransmitter:Na+ symporter, NSS family
MSTNEEIEMNPNQGQSQQWGSKIGVILAVAGSAVGLGNFLRFPGQAAANGGGAFMVPYFIALLLVGIPIGWAEWTMGRYGGKRGFHSAPFILGAVGKNRIFRYIGVLGVLIPMAVSFYYTYIEAWCLDYAIMYLTGEMNLSGDIPAQTVEAGKIFGETVGIKSNGLHAGGEIRTFILWAIVFAINITLVFRGISGGIEKFCQIAMPTMAVCAIIVLVRVLTLGTPNPDFPDQNVMGGLGFMWNPDFGALAKSQTWIAAAGQIFFSLSVGFGVIINYASYMKKKSDVVLSGVTAAATNEVFEVSFGGMITLTSAFIFLGATQATAVAGSTFGLGFNVFPVVFAQMGPLGRVIGAVWFFMLFLAAITSSISMYQPALAFFEESLGKGRVVGTVILVTFCLIGSFMTMYYSKDLIFLDIVDSWVGTLGIYVLAMIQLCIFSYIFGVNRGFDEAHEGAKMHIPAIYKPILFVVSPLFLLILFVKFCYDNLLVFENNPGNWLHKLGVGVDPASLTTELSEEFFAAKLAIGLVIACIIALCGIVALGEKRLEERGIGIEGIDEPGPSSDSGPAGLEVEDE